MHLFGCKFGLRQESGDTLPDRKNFDSLLWATVTVFQVRQAQKNELRVSKIQINALASFSLGVIISYGAIGINLALCVSIFFSLTMRY